MTKKIKQLSIKERIDLLDEAISFFDNLGKEREDMDYLLFKAAAMSWTKKSYEYMAKNVLNKEMSERDEADVKEATRQILQNMDFAEMMEREWISDSDAFWFYGWVGLAIGILRGNEKLIKDFREVQDKRDEGGLWVIIDLSGLLK